MLQDLEFHHIGVVTSNLEKAVKTYKALGFIVSTEPVEVTSQQVKVCFLEKVHHPKIELIIPFGDSSPVKNLIQKCGSGPYHLCYKTNDLKKSIKDLRADKFLILSKPVASNAFDNDQIIFAFKNEIGLIEIVEDKNSKICL